MICTAAKTASHKILTERMTNVVDEMSKHETSTKVLARVGLG